MNTYDLLIKKLDAFIRKFYMNHLLRGCLIFLACASGIALLLGVGEYYLYFPSWLKIALLLLLFISGTAAVFIWICIPLLHMQRLGKVISHEQAAVIIGKHFTDVADKLLNILQLKRQYDTSESRELVAASIQQKSDEIVLVPFLKAVNLGKNKKYLRYALPSLLLILVILIGAPQVFRDAANRLMQPEKNFSHPPPFVFRILNRQLSVPQNERYVLNVAVSGRKIPDRVYLVIDGAYLEMEHSGREAFRYTFPDVAQPVSFYFSAAGVHSPVYRLNIVERPFLEGLEMHLAYPAYTGLQNRNVPGFTDVTVPEGTVIAWSIKAQHTGSIRMQFDNASGAIPMVRNGSNPEWSGRMVATRDTVYHIYLSGRQPDVTDSFRYVVQVLPDQSPGITAVQHKDSISGQQVLLSGQASDDYGLTQLNVHYTITDPSKKTVSDKKIPLKRPSGKLAAFQYYLDLATVPLLPGQDLSYYVEAWDNDGIHGPKKGMSEVFTFHQPGGRELDSVMQENAQQMNQRLSNSADASKALNKEAEKVRDALLENTGINWEQQQGLRALTDKQEQIKNQLDALKKRFAQQQKQSEEKKYSDNIQEKEKALEKQIDQAKQELSDQLKKLQELLEQKNRDNAFRKLQEWQEQNKLFNMDLERISELMKKLELQMKLEDLAGKASELAKEQQKLSEQTGREHANNEALMKEQSGLKKQLDNLVKKDLPELEKLQEAQPEQQQQNLEPARKKGDMAGEEMQQSEMRLQQHQHQNAQKSQNNAAQHLQEMAASMMQAASGMDMQQIDIDIRAVRQLLTNLIRYSFAQEELMEKEKVLPVTSPLYITQTQKQSMLKDNARMIKDSLFALSKRVFQLAPTINKETTEWNRNVEQAISLLEDRHVPEARVRQQYAMSNANNLALLLNETLAHLMQMQAQGQQQGAASKGQGTPKPGQGGAGQMMKDIITGQDAVGKGMRQASGRQPGQSGNGQGNGTQNGGQEYNAEQLARLAQQQAALRRQIQDLASMLNSTGNGRNAGLLQDIQNAMNQNETDLVNRRLTSALIARQQQIMSRLLQAEDAIRNQEQDDKRVSNSGKDMPRPMPPELKAYIKERQDFLDLYHTVPATLRPFYKRMAEDYRKKIGQPDRAAPAGAAPAD